MNNNYKYAGIVLLIISIFITSFALFGIIVDKESSLSFIILTPYVANITRFVKNLDKLNFFLLILSFFIYASIPITSLILHVGKDSRNIFGILFLSLLILASIYLRIKELKKAKGQNLIK